MFENIAAGIVTYEPKIDRLKENIDGVIKNQIRRIIIVDNGSINVESILKIRYEDIQITVIKNENNYGIAKALNQIFEQAEQEGYEWVLTLDQDSVILPWLMETYSKYMINHEIASLTCLFSDRNYEDIIHPDKVTELVTECFTSGNLVRTETWKKVGGFNEKLFIDLVDSDFCYRLCGIRARILRINKVCMIHELGNVVEKHVLGKRYKIYNHSAFRKYYIARNGMYCMRRFPKIARVGDRGYSFIPITILKILLGETRKTKKIARFMHGLVDGIIKYNEIKSGEGRP